MPTVAVQNLNERTRRHEGESLSARSPLSEAEKEAIVRAEYFPTAHRIGLITSLIHVVIFFLPPLYLTVFYGPPADWGKIMQGAAATWSVSMPLWFIEPVSYFLVLGICGTYISFLAGNISNFRLPVSAVAQEVAQVQEGSHEGEIISTLAIAATQIMITISALTGAIFVGAIVGLLPVSLIIGHSANQRLLIVSFTEREPRTRIIGAREATAHERQAYEQNTAKRAT